MKTIKHLAEEAGIERYADQTDLQRFAALVAEQCATAAEQSGGLDATMAAQAIRERFPKP